MNTESRLKKFFYSIVANAVYQIVLLLYGFFVPWIILKYYGSQINGLVSSINQFITYFSLVEAGIAGAAVYALYGPLAGHDQDKINGIVSAARKYYDQAGCLFTALVFALAWIYPVFKRTDDLPPVLVGVLVVILGAKCFFDFFSLAKYRVLLTADQKGYVISAASIVYQLINIAVIYILAHLQMNIVLVYGTAITALVVRTMILSWYVKRHYIGISYHVRPMDHALDKRWDVLVIQMLNVVQNGAPVVLVTFFQSLAMVSIYSVYNMVIQGLNGILGIFTSSLSAFFGDVLIRGEKELLTRTYHEFMFLYSFFSILVFAAATILLTPFVCVYTAGISDADYNLPLLGILLGLAGFLGNIKEPQANLILSAGHYRETRSRMLIQTLLVVLPACMFINFQGLYGIAVSLCIASLYRIIDLTIYVPRKIIGISVKSTVFSMIWSAALYAICVLAGMWMVEQMPAAGFADWIRDAFFIGMLDLVIVSAGAFVFYRKTLLCVCARAGRLCRL